jgi:predicted MPP superfamily phosphohydrolase
MFLLRELIYLSPLGFYVCYRVRTLFSGKAAKNVFTGLFLLLLVAIPADLVIGALRLFGIISRETVRRPGFRRTRLWAYVILPVVIVILGILNFRHLRIKEYAVEVSRRSSAVESLKIVFAADLHLGELTRAHFLENFVAKVNAQNPDLVLLGGDIFEGDRRDEATDKFVAQFRRIRSGYGVFGVPGNHERYGGDRGDVFIRAGIRMLRDEVEKIDGAIYLAGRNDSRRGGRKSIEDLLAGTPDDLPVIVLDHRPIDLERISRRGVDIQFSGHTHHGQLFPINFITKHIYELSWGYKKKLQTHVFVTSGAQLWGPPVRTAGASEILAIKVAMRAP